MELKKYQRRVVEEVERFLRALARERAAGNQRHGSKDAWEALRLGRYEERRNGLNEDLPTICIKVPTGGGKTLLATQVLGSVYRTILCERNGAGLVVWVVPSSQIYRDTLRRLRDRRDMYRLMLEHAVSRRIEVWEKGEIARLSPARLRDCLNILIVQLASTNRETKDQLKFFKDSGGSIVDHFPHEGDLAAHRALKEMVPNLELLEGGELIKTSAGNLVRLCRPAVILDEGHKATSALARRTIEGFNASIVVELSATPVKWKDGTGAVRTPNIVSRVSGEELLDEQMIKIPINIATSGIKKWEDVLTKARDKRAALAAAAARHASATGATLIRPIVLVQVERTGQDQRAKGYIHAEQVKEYLIQRLNVPERAIAIKSAENDGLEDVNLEDEGCPIEWIITKSALQEGWDCPFAYILCSLNESGSNVAMTQLVGRILRQPFQTKTKRPELDESYVFCLRESAGAAAQIVKKALEKEGYEGSNEALVRDSSAEDRAAKPHRIPIRTIFTRQYGKPFKGKIYLPRFCVKDDRGRVRPLDYFQDLISRVDVDGFEYGAIDWNLNEEVSAARDCFQRITLGGESQAVHETMVDHTEDDGRVLAWLVANLGFDFLSHKQLRRVAERVYRRLCESHLSGMVKGRLVTVKFIVRERIAEWLTAQVDRQTEAAFRELFDKGRIFFFLDCKECNFEIPEFITLEATRTIRTLQHDDGGSIAKFLFELVPENSVNEYEKQIALVMDRDKNVLWWYRNLVGEGHFAVQGYKKERIYPDFVVQRNHKGAKYHTVLVFESKGGHLKGNPDTMYKQRVASYFEKAGHLVKWQELGKEFKDHIFRFQVLDETTEQGREWKDRLRSILASPFEHAGE